MKILVLDNPKTQKINSLSILKSSEGVGVPVTDEMNYKSRKFSFTSIIIVGTLLFVFFSVTVCSAYVYTVNWDEAEVSKIESNSSRSGPSVTSRSETVNDRPIIGILAQEYYINGDYEHPNLSYIASSYVKFVEGSGARVVPIFLRQNESYYEKMFNGINGLLIPGGAVYFNDSGYSAAGQILVKLAKDAYDTKGDYFPIFGTCLGFQFLVYEVLKEDVLAYCDSWNSSDNLEFTEEASSSQLYGSAPKSIMELLSTSNVTVNFHRRCLTEDNILANNLNQHFKFLSWTQDPISKIPYVSSMESINYPIFGVQFHPEKNLYEWNTVETIPHSAEAIEVGQWFGNFLINHARKNSHKFKSEEEEDSYLIYNYSPVFTGLKPTATFEQRYIFQIHYSS